MATKTIGSDGARQYGTLELHASYMDGLNTLSEPEIGEAYADSEFTVTAGNALVDYTGFTPSSGNRFTLRCATGESHSDAARTSARKYDATLGVAGKVSSIYGPAIRFSVPYVTFEGWMVQGAQDRNGAEGVYFSSCTGIECRRLIVNARQYNIRGSGGSSLLVDNCLLYGDQNTDGRIFLHGGVLTAYKNTIANSTQNSAHGIGIKCIYESNGSVGEGNVFVNVATPISHQATYTYSNCVTTAASFNVTVGGTAITSASATNILTQPNMSSGFDGRLVDTTGAGKDISSGSVPGEAVDGSNLSRPQGANWDAGWWEIEVSGGATTITATASLDAAIQKTRAATASLSAAIQQTRTATASLSAAIATTPTATAALGATIRQGRSATASLTAAVRGGKALAASLSAAVQASQSLTAQLAAAVASGRTAGASLSATIVGGTRALAELSAAIQAGRSATAQLAAVVQATRSAAVQLGATIRAGRSAGASLSAAVRAPRAATAGLSAVIVGGTEYAPVNVGTGQDRTASSTLNTLAVSTGVTVPAGSTIFVCAGVEVNLNPITGISDGVGNVYSQQLNRDANSPDTAIWTAYVATEIPSGGTITITWTNVEQSRCASIFYVPDVYLVKDASGTGRDAGGDLAVSVSTSGANSGIPQFVVGVMASRAPVTDTAPTQATGYDDFPVRVGTTGGTDQSNVTLFGGAKTIEAEAVQTYDPTLGVDRVTTMLIATFIAADPPGSGVRRNYGRRRPAPRRDWMR